MDTPHLVIFDMDGLMFDTERQYNAATLALMERHGITVNIDILFDAIGSSYFDVDRFLVHVPQGVDAKALLDSVPEAVTQALCRDGVPVKKGLIRLLDLLRSQGIAMCVATSTPISRSGPLLKAAGVWDYFQFVITGRDVAHGKPAPDIFLAACQRAGVSPEQALVLEDSANGAFASQKAGIPYIIVPDLKQPPKAAAESALAVAKDLDMVADMLI